MEISFSDRIKGACPDLEVLKVEAVIENSPSGREVDNLIADTERSLQSLALGDIKLRPAVAATRDAYKKLGKDPNRYRPAAEQLCRRVVRGLGLYRVNAAVDVINVLSLCSGYSIGGFDMDKIQGDVITLGVGHAGEPYEGIGRGELNIEGLPVFRDNIGGIGTPTSDNERTKLSLDTTRLLLTINMYGPEMSVDDTKELTSKLLTDYLGATDIKYSLHKASS